MIIAQYPDEINPRRQVICSLCYKQIPPTEAVFGLVSDDGTQLFLLPMAGGEAVQLTDMKTGATGASVSTASHSCRSIASVFGGKNSKLKVGDG